MAVFAPSYAMQMVREGNSISRSLTLGNEYKIQVLMKVGWLGNLTN